ncbi:MAG: PAS domain S-box protein, partial [Desulfobulbaceae bacterium]|nr:PAS domain S-box protein [Desulfobulbaceae bacterium]
MKDKAIRLLLIEDDKVDQMAFKRSVKKMELTYDYTIAESIAEAERIMKSKRFDVIISDYWLGDGTSFELFDLFKEIPVIVTTGTGNEEVAVEAMKLGACDYLIKDPEGNYLKILPSTVKLAIKRKQNEKELQNYHKHLESMVEERTVELRQSLKQERNVTQIIEKSLNEIFLFDADSYRFLFVNEGARANTGYSQAELLEMTPLDIKPEIDASTFEKIVAPLKNGQKEKVILETVHRRKDGSTYPVEIHLQKTEYLSTPVFAAVIIDITQRKEMEQTYRELVEGTSDLITQVNAEGNLLYVNHMAKEIFGTDPEKLIGQNAFQFLHADDLERTKAWFEECQNRHIRQSRIENRQVNQETGVVLDMLWTSNFHYDEQGKAVSVTGIARDITERKKVETAIRKSEEQWDRTFNSFTDIVTLQETDLCIVKANQAACTILDLPSDEIVGHHCYELFHGSKEPCRDCPLLETKKTFEPYSREMHHEKLGKTFLVSASPVFDEQGELEYIAHVAKDISKLKKLENDLFQAQKMEAIGTLAGGIAHDFNNILSAILGYAELIKNEVSAESTVGKDIEKVLISGQRAADLVKQILAFSRKTGTEKQPLRPHLIVKEALK